jgi:hypothetical protein
VKDHPVWAGTAAGNLITMSTAIKPSVVIHELLHTFGYGDEYQFPNACEADRKCPFLKAKNYLNLALFEDVPPYSSDGDARSRHSQDIPWFNLIKSNVPIVTGKNLGTPIKNVIGLFPGDSCQKATVKLKSWKPGSEPTIMGDSKIETVPKIYWRRIGALLGEDLPIDDFGEPVRLPKDLRPRSRPGAN